MPGMASHRQPRGPAPIGSQKPQPQAKHPRAVKQRRGQTLPNIEGQKQKALLPPSGSINPRRPRVSTKARIRMDTAQVKSSGTANRKPSCNVAKSQNLKHQFQLHRSARTKHTQVRNSTAPRGPNRRAQPESRRTASHNTWTSSNIKGEKQGFEVSVLALSQDVENSELSYPKGLKFVMVILALCLTVLCVALDNTIIATAIPRITDQFHSIEDVGWYGSAYLLTTCALQLTFGKFYTFFSIKWVFLTALFIFEAGSLLCGVAPNSTTLIIGRAIAGIGSAGLFSGAILIVAHTVPLVQRASYTSLIVSMYGVSSVAGPLMGGAFTDHVSWRWCFYINLPCGALTAAFLVFYLDSPRAAKPLEGTFLVKINNLDPFDLVSFTPAIISLLLALQWGGAQYDWSDSMIIVLLQIFVVLMAGFISLQVWRGERATIPPRVIMNRNVWGSAWFAFCIGASFFVYLYYLPIWFQAIKGVSATKSGLMLLPLNISQVIVALLAGAAVTKWGYYTPFMYGAIVFVSLGAGLLTTFQVETGHSKWIGYQVVYGIGIGLGIQQTLIAVQNSVPVADIPIATAIVVFAQSCGGAIFISVAQNIYQNQLIKNLAAAVPGVNPAFVLSTGATQLRDQLSTQFPKSLSAVLVAYSQALTETWYSAVAMSAFAAFGAAAIEWKSTRSKETTKTSV